MAADKKIPYSALPQSEAPPAYIESSDNTQNDLQRLITRTGTLQPQATQPMTVLGAHRNPKSMPIGLDGQRSWSHSLCSCTEVPRLACYSAFCPCMLWANNKARLTSLNATGQPAEEQQSVGLWCGLYALSPQLFGVGQVAMQFISRFQTRERYGIRGNVVEDVLVAAFLPCCSLVQEAREIEEEEIALCPGQIALDDSEVAQIV